MSRTYRKFELGVEFCNNCNKPIHLHTVQQYELCKCPPKIVEMEVRNYKWVTNDEFPKCSEEFPNGRRGKIVYDGWKVVEKKLPQSSYMRYDVELYDGHGYYPTHDNRKEYQQFRNKKFRMKERQVLTDRNTPYEDMVFPVVNKQVDWDCF